MRKVSHNHLRSAHRALRLGFMLVVVLLSQGGRPSTADAVTLGFDFVGQWSETGSGIDVLGLRGSAFTGTFDASGFESSGNPAPLTVNTWVYQTLFSDEAPLKVSGFPSIGAGIPPPPGITPAGGSFITVVAGSGFPPLSAPGGSDVFFYNTDNAGGRGNTPVVTNAQLALADFAGHNLLGSPTPLDLVLRNMSDLGIAGFPDQHSLSITVTSGNTFSTYLGDLTSLNFPAAAAPEPSTVFLIGSGLLGLAAWRRKQEIQKATN